MSIRIRRVLFASMMAVPAISCSRMQAATIETVKAIPARDFLNSLGVVTHLEYDDGRYADAKEAVEDLDFLGIHQLREGLPTPQDGEPDRHLANSLDVLVAAGNRFDFITMPAGQPLPAFHRQLAAIVAKHADAVIAVEGPNEIDNAPVRYEGLTGEAAGRAFQHELYAMIKADPILQKIPVYYLTGGQSIDLRANPGLADYANGHPYPYQGKAPAPRIEQEFRQRFSMSPPYPRVVTETGYFNRPDNPGGSGVDDATQSKLTLDLLLDGFRQGVAKSFLYQLRSAYPDPHGNSADIEYGLFNLDNSPKPVATAIHNLTTILSDARENHDTQDRHALAFAVAGLPVDGHCLLMQELDGTFALVLWAEPRIWSEARHAAIGAAEVAVTLTFPARVGSIRILDPLLSTEAVRTLTDTTSVDIGLSDHPLVVEVRP